MKTFNVYTHPSKPPRAIKDGFSWPGAFFGGFWTLVKGLWIPSLVIFGVAFAMPIAIPGTAIIMGLVVGFAGNGWLAKKLESDGYSHANRVEATSPSQAVNSTSV